MQKKFQTLALMGGILLVGSAFSHQVLSEKQLPNDSQTVIRLRQLNPATSSPEVFAKKVIQSGLVPENVVQNALKGPKASSGGTACYIFYYFVCWTGDYCDCSSCTEWGCNRCMQEMISEGSCT